MTGAVELPEGTEMVMPGDNVQMKVELIAPIAMEDGLRFPRWPHGGRAKTRGTAVRHQPLGAGVGGEGIIE